MISEGVSGVARGWGLNRLPMATELSDAACVMKPPEKPKRTGSGEFQVGDRVEMGEWSLERALRPRAPSHRPGPVSIWLVTCMLHDGQVRVDRRSSEFCESSRL